MKSNLWLFRSFCCLCNCYEQIQRQDYIEGNPLMSDYWCNIYEAISRGSCFIIQGGSCSVHVCVYVWLCGQVSLSLTQTVAVDVGGKGLSRCHGTVKWLLLLCKHGLKGSFTARQTPTHTCTYTHTNTYRWGIHVSHSGQLLHKDKYWNAPP